jgi:cobalt-precorrin 5A hydrolase
VERGQVRVAGFGFRGNVTLASLREALAVAGGAAGLAAIATVDEKAEEEALKLLARELDVPIRAVPANILTGIATPTRSERIMEKFGTGSVAEATALVSAGRNARLISVRVTSQDRTATAAIAEGDGE